MTEGLHRKSILDQQRARHALDAVREAEKKYRGEQRKKFVSYVESLPASILTNGLGQAAATLLAHAKGDRQDPHRALHDIVEGWLCRPDGLAPYRDAGKLMDAIVQHDRDTYLKAQVEALAYLEWLKRFTVAFLKEKDAGETA